MIGLRARSRRIGRISESGEPDRLRSMNAICSVPHSQSSGVLTDTINAIGPAAWLPSAESVSGMPSMTMLP
jgi:hypothetical protein